MDIFGFLGGSIQTILLLAAAIFVLWLLWKIRILWLLWKIISFPFWLIGKIFGWGKDNTLGAARDIGGAAIGSWRVSRDARKEAMGIAQSERQQRKRLQDRERQIDGVLQTLNNPNATAQTKATEK